MYIILMRHGEAEPETEDIANKIFDDMIDFAKYALKN